MAHKTRTLSVFGLLLSLMWLAACSPAAPTSSPTIDLEPFRTEVAATVLAQVTRELALTPSITPPASPTATSEPSSTPGQTATPTVAETSGTPGVSTDDKAQWVSQSIADDTVFAPGETFTMTWRLKNTGTSTWTENYVLRYFSGEAFGAPKEIPISQEVLPGGEIEISLANESAGQPWKLPDRLGDVERKPLQFQGAGIPQNQGRQAGHANPNRVSDGDADAVRRMLSCPRSGQSLMLGLHWRVILPCIHSIRR